MITIRQTIKEDINGIKALFSFRKSESELKWLLGDPSEASSFRSFVALDESGRVVGHIGYVISRYRYGDLETTGVHPILWIVSEDYRGGGTGVRLMRQVIDCADITLSIGGTMATQKMYPLLFGYTQKTHIQLFNKIIKPLSYFALIDNNFPKQILKTLVLLGVSLKRKPSHSCGREVEFSEYAEEQTLKPPRDDGIFYNEDTSRINWLLNCPLLEAHAFTISDNKVPIGTAVLYVKKNKKNILSGRIAHLSYLGSDHNVWHSALFKIEQFFKRRECAIISTLASYPRYIRSLKDSGYVSIKKNSLPFFLRDPKNILFGVSDDSWHLTPLEGDIGYRGA